MVKTLSTMLPLGTTLPEFQLTDTVSDQTITHTSFPQDHGVLVMFICNHCPYVIHLQEALSSLAQDYAQAPLSIIAISSNDVENYPQDGPTEMKALAEQLGWQFPYCLDDSQELAKTFQAACTPDFYVFGKDKKLSYRGQFDDSRPKNDAPITGHDLRNAIDTMLAGQPPLQEQRPSMGCNIKWKEGNAPSYFPAS